MNLSKVGKIVLIAIVAILLCYQGGQMVNGLPQNSKEPTGPVIGIDLGTTYSACSYYNNAKSEMIPNDQGGYTFPSIVAFTEYDRLIGDSAKNQMQSNPANTIWDAKRCIGRNYDDPTIQKDKKLWPFKVINQDGVPAFEVTYKNQTHTFKPEEISSMVLSKIKQIAEKYIGETVKNAVITVPAYFNDNQRASTKLAAKLAGLNVLRIINEPTAASIAYGLNDAETAQERNIIVYDLGGGTFDVSLLTLDSGVFEVRSTSGDTHLGGQDFDDNIINYFIKKFNKQYNIDLTDSNYMKDLNKLRKACETAKRALSSPDTTQFKIEIDNLAGIEYYNEILSQAKFESLNNKLFKKTIKPLEQVLNDSGLTINDIDEVVMVGGSTRIPKIQQLVSDFFNGKKLNFGINPDEAVAQGAGIQAALLSNHPNQLNKKEIVVTDKCPLSLGINTVGGVFTKIIDRNSFIPTTKSKIFSTYQDNQDAVKIEVYQGERAMSKDNIHLGDFNLNNIPLAPRGVPQIEVIFKIDVNGIVNVEAIDKSSPSNSKQIEIDTQGNLPSQDEINDMIKKAQQFADDDKLIVEIIQLRNELEMNAFKLKDKYNNSDEIVEACDEIIEWLDMNQHSDIDDLKEKKAEFEDIVQPIIANMQSDDYYNNNNNNDYDHEEL